MGWRVRDIAPVVSGLILIFPGMATAQSLVALDDLNIIYQPQPAHYQPSGDDLDLADQGKSFEVTCAVENFQAVADALEAKQIATDVAELSRIPANTVELDAENGRKVLKLMEALEDQDDVQSVTSNYNIPDEIMEEVTSGA